MQERRRLERKAISNIGCSNLTLRLAVEVLDISITGVLLRSSRPLRQGASGTLRLFLGGQPLTTDVVITRVVKIDSDIEPSYRSGAKFTAIDPGYKQIIERFAKQVATS